MLSKDYHGALELKKDSGEAYCILALISFQKGDLATALATAEKAFALEKQRYIAFVLMHLSRTEDEKNTYKRELSK